MSTGAKTPGDLVRAVDFEGHRVTVVVWEGRPVWIAREVGEALGYADGSRLTTKITGEWAEEFIEGVDFEILKNGRLAEFKTRLPPDSGGSRSASLVTLSESGLNLALMKSRKEAGRRLRRFLATEVLPQLVRTGRYAPESPAPALPPPPAPPRDLATVRARLVAELAGELGAFATAGDLDAAGAVVGMLGAVLGRPSLPVEAPAPLPASTPEARVEGVPERRGRGRPPGRPSALRSLPSLALVRTMANALGEELRAEHCTLGEFDRLRAVLGSASNLADLVPHIPRLVVLARELNASGQPVTPETLTAALATDQREVQRAAHRAAG